MNAPPLPFMAAPITAMLLLSMCLSFGQQLVDRPYISEIMADNRETLLDEDEDASDWIEIHYLGEAPYNLEGHTLTDDPAAPAKWTFPDVTLEQGMRLLVFASGKDRRAQVDRLHANFSLDADGEYLGLFDNEGAPVSVIESFPELEEDQAYGWSASERPVTLINTRSSCRWEVPFGNGTDLSWTTLEFSDAFWFNGSAGIGYDFGLDYHEWIATDISFEMAGFATTARVRIPFEVEDPSMVERLVLNLRFDDGYAAFLNGTQVSSEAAPIPLRADSEALFDRLPADGIQEVSIDLSEHVALLVEGENVLALQGLDISPTSGDFLLHPRLEMYLPVPTPAYGYLPEPSPLSENRESYAGRVGEVQFDRSRRFLDGPMELALTTETEGATIFYSFDGSEPTLEESFAYEGPFEIDETLAIRARAFRDDLMPSRVSTRTYVDVQELAAQSLLNQAIVAGERTEVEAQFRSGLPILSVAVDGLSMFGDGGIDTIPEQTRELPVSLEYFHGDDPEGGFQINAGLAIHGGNARVHPKKPYRLFFRRDYGAARLNFPLFEGSPVTSFDQLILRAGGHDSWSISPDFGSTDSDLPPHATYLKDQFLRQTEIEMGALSPRGRYVHVLLNGFYWGIYDLHERPNATFFSDHLGGRESEWDVLHHADTLDTQWAVIDGSDRDWASLHGQLESGIANELDYLALQANLDIPSLIDSLIVRMWSADYDWAGPLYWLGEEAQFFRNKNWYVARRSDRAGAPGFYRFFSWDAEMSMGSHLLTNSFSQAFAQRVLDFDLTAVDDPGTPAGIHGALRFLPNYQRAFGDRVQKHLLDEGGALTVDEAERRLLKFRETLEPVMVGESARWGDLHVVGAPFTRSANWLPEVEWLRSVYLPQRREILLQQLASRGLTSAIEAPAIQPPGGSLDGVNAIELQSLVDGGVTYYTTDGSDPALGLRFTRRVLVDEQSAGHYLVPSIQNGGSTLQDSWRELEVPPFFETWTTSRASVGFDTDAFSFYGEHFENDVSEMIGVNTTLYLRVPFELQSTEALSTLILRVKYDDGFAAFLNGQPLAAAAAPDDLTWFSAAAFRRADEDAVFYRDYDVSEAIAALQEGSNMLAIQVMNGSIASSDLLFSCQLIAVEAERPQAQVASPEAVVYEGAFSLGETTQVKARTRAPSGEWSNLTEALFFPGTAPEAGAVRISEIHYHPRSTDDFPSAAYEFLELTNTTDAPVQLEGLRFSEGIDHVLESYLLGPGETALLVNQREAFLSRYDEAMASQIVGTFGETSRLSNGGETLTLVDRYGLVIDRVTYNDREPWPQSADGEGVSLERVTFEGEGGAEQWRSSMIEGGTPGTSRVGLTYAVWAASASLEGEQAQPEADPDGDGLANVIEYVTGRSPLDERDGAQTVLQVQAGVEDASSIELRYRRLADLSDAQIHLETSEDLSEWGGVVDIVEEEIEALEDLGLEEVHLRVPPAQTRWYRLRVTLP